MLILGYFVTLFFFPIYILAPNIQMLGQGSRVEGLSETLEASAGAGTGGPLTLHSGE